LLRRHLPLSLHSSVSPPLLFFLRLRRAPPPTLFPYTTLFRSAPAAPARAVGAQAHAVAAVRQQVRGRQRGGARQHVAQQARRAADRKSTRLNSSHQIISYAVFCLKKKKLHGIAGDLARVAAGA